MMRKGFTAICSLVLLCQFYSAPLYTSEEGAKTLEKAEEEGKVLPDLSLKDTKGVKKGLRKLKGKVTLILFWKSNIGNAWNMMKRLKEVYPSYSKKGFRVIAIDAYDTPDERNDFLKKAKLPYTVLVDSEEEAINELEIKVIPTTIVYDPGMKEVLRVEEFSDEKWEEIDGLLKSLLGITV